MPQWPTQGLKMLTNIYLLLFMCMHEYLKVYMFTMYLVP